MLMPSVIPLLPSPTELNYNIGFLSLPTELVLEIIPNIPYSLEAKRALESVSTNLFVLLKRHEQSLVSEIKQRQIDSSHLKLFQNLAKRQDWQSLDKLTKRINCLHETHAHWLKIVNHGVELRWLRGRWERIHMAGLLLLYRLRDAASEASFEVRKTPCEANKIAIESIEHANTVELLNSLPATSLACLLFKLISSVKILRVHGPKPIHVECPLHEDSMVRNDIELAAEELLLRYGPGFFTSLLDAGSKVSCKDECSCWAVSALNEEIASMVARQQDPMRPPTLISSLRRAFARATDCELHATSSKMWEVLSFTGFDEMNLDAVAQVVNGEFLEGRMSNQTVRLMRKVAPEDLVIFYCDDPRHGDELLLHKENAEMYDES